MRRPKPSLERGIPAKLRELPLKGMDSRAFRIAVRPALRAFVAFDAYCINTTDPVTRAITSSVGDGLLPAEARRLFALERRGSDLNLLAELAVRLPRVVRMSATTRGAPHESTRMRTIFLPKGLTDELRAALVWGDRVWGYLHLFRKGTFSAADAERIDAVAPLLALGLARATIAPARARRTLRLPELVELDARGTVRGAPAVRAVLAAIDLDGHQPIPHGVIAANAPERAGALRTPTGEWIAFRRFEVGARTLVLLDRATEEEVRRTMMLGFGLTTRERQVARLVGEGLTNAQLSKELGVTLHTAKDHVRALLAKTGASTRAQLVKVLATGS